MRRAGVIFPLLALIAVVVAAISYGFPQTSAPAAAQGTGSRRVVGPQQTPPSFSGEVVYFVHAGKSGRLLGESTDNIDLVLIPETSVTIQPRRAVAVEVKTCLELAVTRPSGAGVLATIDGIAMTPNAGGPSSLFLAGWVVQPPVAPVLEFSRLDAFCFNWTSDRLAAGQHTIEFYWAVEPVTPASRLWGDFFSTSVWATTIRR